MGKKAGRARAGKVGSRTARDEGWRAAPGSQALPPYPRPPLATRLQGVWVRHALVPSLRSLQGMAEKLERGCMVRTLGGALRPHLLAAAGLPLQRRSLPGGQGVWWERGVAGEAGASWPNERGGPYIIPAPRGSAANAGCGAAGLCRQRRLHAPPRLLRPLRPLRAGGGRGLRVRQGAHGGCQGVPRLHLPRLRHLRGRARVSRASGRPTRQCASFDLLFQGALLGPAASE